jgi:hypothetical protein
VKPENRGENPRLKNKLCMFVYLSTRYKMKQRFYSDEVVEEHAMTVSIGSVFMAFERAFLPNPSDLSDKALLLWLWPKEFSAKKQDLT